MAPAVVEAAVAPVAPVAEPEVQLAPVSLAEVLVPAPEVVAAPAPAAAVAVVAEAPAEAAAPAPVAAAAAPFVLPTDKLADLARASGLEWINSDPDKVRVVQEAIANEPAPVRVPREIRPVVLVDEGPLVLVETRRDLAAYQLPFEQASESAPAA